MKSASAGCEGGTVLDRKGSGPKKRVQRGGSHLCTSDYCARYMVGSRGKGEPESPAGHVGFRCVLRVQGG